MVLVVKATLPMDLSGNFPVYLQWSIQCCQCIFPGNKILCSQGNLNQSQFLSFLVMWHIHHVFRLCRWHIWTIVTPNHILSKISLWLTRASLCLWRMISFAFTSVLLVTFTKCFVLTSVLWNPNIPPTQYPTPFPISWLEDFGTYASILEVSKVVGDWLHLPIYQKILHVLGPLYWLIQQVVLLLLGLLFGQREAASNLYKVFCQWKELVFGNKIPKCLL